MFFVLYFECSIRFSEFLSTSYRHLKCLECTFNFLEKSMTCYVDVDYSKNNNIIKTEDEHFFLSSPKQVNIQDWQKNVKNNLYSNMKIPIRSIQNSIMALKFWPRPSHPGGNCSRIGNRCLACSGTAQNYWYIHYNLEIALVWVSFKCFSSSSLWVSHSQNKNSACKMIWPFCKWQTGFSYWYVVDQPT